MPKPSQSNRKHIFYNPNIKRQKSWDKYKNLIERFVTLLKREKKEGTTKRIVDAKRRAFDKMKSFGVSLDMVNSVITHKWLKGLSLKKKTR